MEPCQTCHVGHLLTRRATYLLAYGGQLVTVPGTPAWWCDYCGELTYDEHLLERLDMLLGVDAELEPDQRARARRPAAGFGRLDQPARRRV